MITKPRDPPPRGILTPLKVDRLIEATRSMGRHGERNALMMGLAYRHGLRISELIKLRWAHVDLTGSGL